MAAARHAPTKPRRTTRTIYELQSEPILAFGNHVPALSKRRRDELEMLLSIFDQANRQENHPIMNVKETDFPERFRPVIRRLRAAAQEKEVRDIMTLEDDFVVEINDYEHRITNATKQKEKAIHKQEEAVRLLLSLGMSAEDTAGKLNLSLEYVKTLK